MTTRPTTFEKTMMLTTSVSTLPGSEERQVMGWFKSEDEKWAEAKLDPKRNAKAARGLTAKETVARQIKANDAKNRRRK